MISEKFFGGGFIAKETCSFKVGIYQNRDGNILQEGETVAGQKNFTFGSFKSDITAAESINDENSPALHNGVAGLTWLFSSYNEGNFDTLIQKVTTEIVEDD